MRVRERFGLVAGLAAATLLMSGSAVGQEAPPVEPEDVAQVGEVAIPRADFDRWLVSAIHAHFERPLELVGPEYTRCVEVKRRERVAKRWRVLGDAELRARCGRDHRSLRRQVMQFLIQGQWVQQEAERQGVEVGTRQVDRLFESQRRVAFPDRRSYERFLRGSGADEEAIKYRVWLDALQTKITRRVSTRARPVTRRDVARYRAAHPGRFAGMKRAKANRRGRSLLESQRQQQHLAGFIEGFRSRYRAITWCADGYVIAECGALARPTPPA